MSLFALLFLAIIFMLLWPLIKIALKVWWLHRQVRRSWGNPGQQQPFGSRQSSHQHRQQPRQTKRRRGKRIPSDIGEYAEYEEIILTREEIERQSRRTPVTFKRQEQVSDAEWEEIR